MIKRRIKLLLASISFSLLLLLVPRFTSAQTPEELTCIGTALAEYMNAVIAGAGNLTHVKLTSPAFNLTSQYEPAIFNAMVQANANFAGLDAYAGNTYTIAGKAAYDYYVQNGWRARFVGKPVIFTEFGDFGIRDNEGSRAQIIERMYAEYNRTTLDSQIMSINYFNALGTNQDPNFAHHILSEGELAYITQNNRAKGGVNSGVYVDASGGFAGRVAGVGLNWTVEIIYGPGDLQSAAAAVNNSPINPVLRLCVQNTCGFTNPNDLVAFLKELDTRVNKDVWVIAGPNEPATEHWAAPECTGDTVEIPEPPIFPIVVEPLDYEPEKMACGRNNVLEPEFHSLRPYPASPCLDEVGETALLCGSSLTVKDIFLVDYNDADPGRCAGTVCNFSISAALDLFIDTSRSDLPIAGNTELVWNSVRQEEYITPAQRMNEYVSWYLHGVIGRAEEPRLTYYDDYPIVELQGTLTPEGLSRLINFSGPIRKLWPLGDYNRNLRASTGKIQVWQIEQDRAGRSEPERHNQVVACNSEGVGSPLRCYGENEFVFTRLVSGGGSEGVELPDSAFRTYIPYSSTEDSVGELKSEGFEDLNGVEYTSPSGETAIIRATFTPAPESGVDTIGTLFRPGSPTIFINPAIQLTEFDDNAYFAHLEEDNELSMLLQKTYAPAQGNYVLTQTGLTPIFIPGLPPTFVPVFDTVYSFNEEAYYESLLNPAPTGTVQELNTNDNEFCTILKVRRNPGDRIFGDVGANPSTDELMDPDDVSLGVLQYNAQFSCDLGRPEIDEEDLICTACIETFYQNCIGQEGTDAPGCLHAAQDACINGGDCQVVGSGTCDREIQFTIPVETHTPEVIDDIWKRTVAGASSIFRKIFPKFGPDSVIERVEDIPTVTGATYGAERLASNLSDDAFPLLDPEVKPGDPALNLEPNQAQLFFPHLGGVHEYFLRGIQAALRPEGARLQTGFDVVIPDDEEVVIPGGEVNCNTNAPEPNLGEYAGRVITKDQLRAYLELGGRPFPDLVSLENMIACWNDIVGRALETYNDPALSLAIWAEESWASNYEELGARGLLPVADMGCTVGVPLNNYSAQVNCFHQLTWAYANPGHWSYDLACRQIDGDTCLSVREFALLFEGGRQSCEANDFTIEPQFPARLQQYYSVASNGNALNLSDDLVCIQGPPAP